MFFGVVSQANELLLTFHRALQNRQHRLNLRLLNSALKEWWTNYPVFIQSFWIVGIYRFCWVRFLTFRHRLTPGLNVIQNPFPAWFHPDSRGSLFSVRESVSVPANTIADFTPQLEPARDLFGFDSHICLCGIPGCYRTPITSQLFSRESSIPRKKIISNYN